MKARKSQIVPALKLTVKPKVEHVTESGTWQRIFVLCHFLFGLNNGFVEVNNQKLLKALTMLQSTALFAFASYAMISSNEGKMTWFHAEAIVYIMFVVITMTNRYTYHDFQVDLSRFDQSINADSKSYRFALKFNAFFLFVVFITITNSLLLYEDGPIHISAHALPALLVIIMSNDFVRITFVFVFSCAHWRIRKFIAFVKKDDVDVIECQHLYRRIVDIVERAKNNFNFVFLITLIYNTATSTAILFLPFINSTVRKKSLYIYVYNGIDVARNLFMLFAPTFTAGHLSAEVETLVLTLRDKVIQTKDETQRRDIKRLINYIEARPMKFTVYSVITLDWNLPITIVNISITYLIVMIQFTHNY